LCLLPKGFSPFRIRQNFVDSISPNLSSILGEWNLKLECKVPDQPFEINADFAQLKKAISHLIENAVKYSKQGSTVSLTISHIDDQVRFEISDKGPGMTAEQIDVALEPMRQIDGSTSRMFEGMGLGLPLAKGIAELHGGSMKIDSKPGEGTIVALTVPVDSEKS